MKHLFDNSRQSRVLIIPKVDKNSGQYYSDKVMRRAVKELINNCKQQPPRLIWVGNQLTTSLKKICNYANQNFVNKIKKLRDKFVINANISPLQLLYFL